MYPKFPKHYNTLSKSNVGCKSQEKGTYSYGGYFLYYFREIYRVIFRTTVKFLQKVLHYQTIIIIPKIFRRDS